MRINTWFVLSISSLILMLLAAGCGSSPIVESPMPIAGGSNTISLAPPDEPGERLMLYGTVVDSKTGEPVPHARVYLYHADASGEYQPSDPEDESTARLSGEVTCTQAGEFAVDTIVPREYDQPGNRHIHLHYVRAEGYQDGGGVILFEADVNDEIRQWALDTGFGTIIELEEVNGVQQGNLVITLDPEE